MGERFKIACAVHLILIKNGKILLQRRGNPNKYGYGMLGMPAGQIQKYMMHISLCVNILVK